MMSPILPQISGEKLIKILEKNGYEIIRTKGSHVRLAHPYKTKITVPLHKSLKIGLCMKIIKDTGISIDEIKKHL